MASLLYFSKLLQNEVHELVLLAGKERIGVKEM
jgi:hypothetical protein